MELEGDFSFSEGLKGDLGRLKRECLECSVGVVLRVCDFSECALEDRVASASGTSRTIAAGWYQSHGVGGRVPKLSRGRSKV